MNLIWIRTTTPTGRRSLYPKRTPSEDVVALLVKRGAVPNEARKIVMALARAQYQTWEEVESASDDDLLLIYNIGPRALECIRGVNP